MPIAPQDLLAPKEDAADDADGTVPVHGLTTDGWAAWAETAEPGQAAWAEAVGFTAKKGEVVLVPDAGGAPAAALMGLGAGGEVAEPDPWAYAALADKLPPGRYRLADETPGPAAWHAALGWCLTQYRFDRYTDANAAGPRVLVAPAALDRDAALAGIASIRLVRDLVNTPTNHMGPEALAAAARALAGAFGAKLDETVGEALLEANYPAIHAVGRASDQAPRLIDLTWGAVDAPKVTLVGKGVCFDTGGLNLKPASAMRLMKKDMGGAAHALGLARWIMARGLPVRLRVLIPAVENSVAGNAFRPGDIIATRKGLSVEIGNTDAEGRLVLADALALADEEQPDLMLDFATLTGAARVALGPDLPALFTDDHALAGDLARLAAAEGDPLWRMPLWQPYAEGLASPVADLNNISEGPFAGAITAALFLKRFVETTPAWAHLDVFAWNPKGRPGRPQGGEAMALRAAFALIEERFAGG